MASVEITGSAVQRAEPPARSTWGLIQLAFFWVALNFHWAAVPIVIIPSQIQVFLFSHHPAGLSGTSLSNYIQQTSPGVLAAVVGPGLIVALLSNPLFGYLSDHTRLMMGPRRIYVLVGTLVNVVGLMVMAFAPNPLVLALALMLVQLANNAAAAPFHALLPDLVPSFQRGKASGYMGLGQMLGTILGATIPGLVFGLNATSVVNGSQSVSSYQHTTVLAYGFTAVFVLAMALLTFVTVREKPLATAMAGDHGRLVRDLLGTMVVIGAVTGATVAIMTALRVNLTDETSQNVLILPALIVGTLGVVIAFQFRPRQQGDFFWVLTTRAIVMMGIYTVLSFLQLYLKYVTLANVPNAPSPESASGLFIDIVIVVAALSTAFAGALSDRLGRKRMVYISGAFMALVGIIFLVAPVVLSNAVVLVTFVCAGIFGLGYGAYVSVDWALVTDVLPSDETYARDMGVWNTALTTPQVLSYVIGALAITLFDRGGPLAVAGSPNLGYTMLFVLLVIYAVVGTITVRFIRGVKR
jgi:MFS family permease